MYLKYKKLWNNLTRLQHSVIFLTTLAGPIAFELVQGLYATGLCLSCVNYGMLIVYVVWWQLAMLVISISTMEETAEVQEKLEEISATFNDGIERLRADYERKITRNQDSIDNLTRWAGDVRRVVLDASGVDIPAVPVTLRGDGDGARIKVSVSSPTLCAPASTSRILRLRNWLRIRLLFCSRLIYKVFYNWDSDQANRRS